MTLRRVKTCFADTTREDVVSENPQVQEAPVTVTDSGSRMVTPSLDSPGGNRLSLNLVLDQTGAANVNETKKDAHENTMEPMRKGVKCT